MTIEYWHFALILIAVFLVAGGLGVIAGILCISDEMDALRLEV